METETITGIVNHILFSSPDGAFTILKLTPDDDVHAQNEDGTVTVTGEMHDQPTVGDAVMFEGFWTEHTQYGPQFKALGLKKLARKPAMPDTTAPQPQRPAANSDKAILRGVIERITYYNPENGWGVIKLQPHDDADYPDEAISIDGVIAVVGVMPELIEGESAEFTGKWVHNEQYGKQFKCETVIPIMPNNKQGIIRYIADTVYGIGDVTATRIYKHFGDETLTILDNNPMAIYEVPGLKPNLARNLLDVWSESRGERQIMIHLQNYGITSRLARTIYETYGMETIQIVERDPYQLADDVFGIGFKKADQIAQGMGVAADAPTRLRAGLVYTLSSMASDGHTYAPYDVLLEQAVEMLGIQGTEANLETELQQQILANKLFRDRLWLGTEAEVNAVYTPIFHRSETGSADKLRAIATSPSPILTAMRDTDWDAYLADLAQDNAVNLSPLQQSAVKAALTSKVSVLTGGPGTGKTTTLRMVINALDAEGYSYRLGSPTGRAAKRLAEATERDASTIHRLLGWDVENGGFIHGEDDPLDTDCIIIDEASMIDLVLFYSLLKAIKPGTHLMLVGDVDQLPSVGAGNVLNDVIDSGVAFVTRLNQIFRQDDDSHIITNAHRINQGLMPFTDNESRDFFFFNMADPVEAGEMIVDLVASRLQRKLGDYDPINDVQVIAPMYRGPIGVNALNEALQSTLNPASARLAEKRFGQRVFRIGDKVMQTKNNYEKEVFNGDIGIIHAIDDDDNSLEVVIDGRFITYDYADADEQLMHAYCISTHRSQGSEYPVVVMPIMTQHYIMLQRNLLYTAITRAKKMVVLVGTRKAIKIAVDNNRVAERYSGLLARLRLEPPSSQQTLF